MGREIDEREPQLFVLVVLFQLLDLSLTMVAFQQNGEELNPIAAYLIDQLGTFPGLLVLKSGLLLSVYIAWKHTPIQRRTRYIVLLTALLAGLGASLWNAWWIMA